MQNWVKDKIPKESCVPLENKKSRVYPISTAVVLWLGGGDENKAATFFVREVVHRWKENDRDQVKWSRLDSRRPKVWGGRRGQKNTHQDASFFNTE